MANSLMLPALASSALIAALLIIFQKQQKTDWWEGGRHDRELLSQHKGEDSQGQNTYPEDTPTRSSRPYQTRRDVLIKERDLLTQSGLGPQHPRMHSFNILIDGYISSVNQPNPSREFLLKESTNIVREKVSLRRRQESLLANGLGRRHTTALAINEQLRDLSLAEEILQKQIRKKALSREESAF